MKVDVSILADSQNGETGDRLTSTVVTAAGFLSVRGGNGANGLLSDNTSGANGVGDDRV